MIDILLAAFLLSLVLLGIHSYFGLEIIRRGIIFTDLAIGQMSALGASISILFLDGKFVYPISLCFALAGGVIIAFASRRDIHLEAFIGLLYAFGLSGVFIALSKSYHGMETFQNLLAADILFTPSKEIIKTAVLYAGLGGFLFWTRRKLKGKLQDMLFFITFSVTVTSSVRLAGVLVVFALLVAPAMIALKCGSKRPLFVAWGVGTVVNLIAIAVSYQLDLPTGYAIVFLNALAALAVSAFHPRCGEPR
jgi:zinc/manganese transport system permease protein